MTYCSEHGASEDTCIDCYEEHLMKVLERWRWLPEGDAGIADEIDRMLAHMANQKEAIRLLREERDGLKRVADLNYMKAIEYLAPITVGICIHHPDIDEGQPLFMWHSDIERLVAIVKEGRDECPDGSSTSPST